MIPRRRTATTPIAIPAIAPPESLSLLLPEDGGVESPVCWELEEVDASLGLDEELVVVALELEDVEVDADLETELDCVELVALDEELEARSSACSWVTKSKISLVLNRFVLMGYLSPSRSRMGLHQRRNTRPLPSFVGVYFKLPLLGVF